MPSPTEAPGAVAERPPQWWRSPAAQAVAYVLLATAVFYAIVLFGDRFATDEDYVRGRYRVWAGIVTLSLTVWVVLLLRGVAVLRAPSAGWRRGRRWWAWNVAAYVLLIAAAVGMLAGVTSGNKLGGVPVRHFELLIDGLTAVGAAAAAPWVLMLWQAHEEVRRLARSVGAIERPPDADEFVPDEVDAPGVTAATRSAQAVWEAIQRCSLALALILSTLVFNTAALRASLIDSGVVEASDAPPWLVLGYGAFFAAVVAVAVVPLVIAWRSAVAQLVDRALSTPGTGVPADSLLAARARLETRLHIDAPILRRPIAALSILSPLVTALLTAFVPGLS